MNQEKIKKVLKKVAKKHNVTVEEVEREIQKAIELARLSPDPNVQRAWEHMTFGGDKTLTPEQLISCLSKRII